MPGESNGLLSEFAEGWGLLGILMIVFLRTRKVNLLHTPGNRPIFAYMDEIQHTASENRIRESLRKVLRLHGYEKRN